MGSFSLGAPRNESRWLNRASTRNEPIGAQFEIERHTRLKEAAIRGRKVSQLPKNIDMTSYQVQHTIMSESSDFLVNRSLRP